MRSETHARRWRRRAYDQRPRPRRRGGLGCAQRGGEAGGRGRLGPMMDRRVRGLVLISLLAAFCGGLAWAHGQELFAAAFAAAAVVAGFETALRCTGERGSLWMSLDNGLALACEAVRREKEEVWRR